MEVETTTSGDFPTYAELTQTQGWVGGPPAPVSTQHGPESSSARYAESAVLGVGGMGKVVLARDQRIGREVAVKQLRSDRELSEAERDRFLREAHVQGQLEHPSIVPVYDIDRRPDGTMFFTMRRVLGRTLHSILEDRKRGVASKYSQRELLQAFGTVCLAIDYAHSRGVVHRDLKPSNIMLGDFGEVYVLDWGLARIVAPRIEEDGPPVRLSVPGTMMGTPLYIAPEQMTDPDVGPAADVFALGAILFEILTNERLRDPRALALPIDAHASVRFPDRPIAPELEMICVRATQEDPAERFASARALHDALARFLEGDRELEQRRTLAAQHATRAKHALRRSGDLSSEHEIQRGVAMRELLRALALEPTNQEHVAMLAEIMATPPLEMPREVRERVDAQTQEVMQSGARHVVLSTLTWFLFLPAVLALGLLRVDLLVLGMLGTITTVITAWIAMRRPRIDRTLQFIMLAGYVGAALVVTRLFGPLILVPTLMASTGILMQAHPDRTMRRVVLVVTVAVIVLPMALETIGLLPSSYAFIDGGFAVLPQMTRFQPLVTYVFLTAANVGIIVVPALFVARLRDALSHAQTRELVQSWHFRRLSDDLIKATQH